MSLMTGVTRLFHVDSRADGRPDADFYGSLLAIEDELELCCMMRQGDPARTLIRRQLKYLVRAFNIDPALSSQALASPRCIRHSRNGRRPLRSSRGRLAAMRWRRVLAIGRR